MDMGVVSPPSRFHVEGPVGPCFRDSILSKEMAGETLGAASESTTQVVEATAPGGKGPIPRPGES